MVAVLNTDATPGLKMAQPSTSAAARTNAHCAIIAPRSFQAETRTGTRQFHLISDRLQEPGCVSHNERDLSDSGGQGP